MRGWALGAILSGYVLGIGATARADGPERLVASLQALRGRTSQATSVGGTCGVHAPQLSNTGAAAESIFCLTFDRGETRRTFGLRGVHVYACFNFLRNPAEAAGAVLGRQGRPKCLVTGSFRQGPTPAEDCLILALCGDVFVTGAC